MELQTEKAYSLVLGSAAVTLDVAKLQNLPVTDYSYVIC